MTQRYVQIRHYPTGAVIAQGPLGWGITPFEGNYYIRRRYLRDGCFRINAIPGMCIYKGLYIGLDYIAPDQTVSKHLGWMYWLPNPLFPFTMYRVAVPGSDPSLVIELGDEPLAHSHALQAQQLAEPRLRLDPDGKFGQPCHTIPP